MPNKKSVPKKKKPVSKLPSGTPEMIYSPLERDGAYSDLFYSSPEELISDQGTESYEAVCIVFVPLKVVRISNKVTVQDL